MIDVLVVDDHAIFRSGLKRLLSDESDVRVGDEAKDGAEALAKLRAGTFDVVLLDINLPGMSGLEVLEAIRAEWPELPVVMLSMYPEDQYALVALKARANGYISKDMDPAELVEAIRQVAGGGRYLPPRIAGKVLLQLDGRDDRLPHQKLSARELQVMQMIVKGMSLTEIGEKMFISVKTVSTYRSRILEKLDLGSNAELVRYAVRHQLID